MAIVYRVEHKTKGFGPYHREYINQIKTKKIRENLASVSAKLGTAHSYSNSHPVIGNDIQSEVYDNYTPEHFCGFGTLGQLKDWFDGFLDLLSQNKYVCKVFEVPDDLVLHTDSGKQVCFLKAKSKLIRTMPLDKLEQV